MTQCTFSQVGLAGTRHVETHDTGLEDSVTQSLNLIHVFQLELMTDNIDSAM